MTGSRIPSSFSRDQFSEFCASAPGDIDPNNLVEKKPGAVRFACDQPLYKYLTPGEAVRFHLWDTGSKVTKSTESGEKEEYEPSNESGSWSNKTATSLLVTDAWLRLIICGGEQVVTQEQPPRSHWEDLLIKISVYSITDISESRSGLEEKVSSLSRFNNDPTTKLEIQTRRDQKQHTFKVAYQDDEARTVASYLSDRLSAREAAEERLAQAVDHLNQARTHSDEGGTDAAIASINNGLEAIESAVFEYETAIGVERTSDDDSWGIKPTTPAAENWLEALSWALAEKYGFDIESVSEAIQQFRDSRRAVARDAIETAVERAQVHQQEDEHIEAATAYERAENYLDEYGEYLSGEGQNQYRDLKKKRVNRLVDGARRYVSDGSYEEADTAYGKALAVSHDAGRTDHSQIVEEWIRSLVSGTRDVTTRAQVLRDFIIEWTTIDGEIKTALEESLESQPERTQRLLWHLTQTFDGSSSDAAIAAIIRKLLENQYIEIDEASITALLESSVADNRRLACEILAIIGDEDALDALRDLQDDSDYDTRVAALRALKTIAQRTGVSLTEDEQRRAESVEIVHHGDGDIVTGTQDTTVVEDSVVNRSAIDTEQKGGTDSQSQSSSTQIRFCPDCGIDLSEFESVSFCPNCGTELTSSRA